MVVVKQGVIKSIGNDTGILEILEVPRRSSAIKVSADS